MSATNLSITIEKSKDGFTLTALLGGKSHINTIKTGDDMLRAMSTLAVFLLDGGVPAEKIPEIQKEVVDGIKGGYANGSGSGIGIAIGNGSTGVSIRGHAEGIEFESTTIVDVDQIPTILKETEVWLQEHVDSDLAIRSMMARTESGLKEAIEHFWERVKAGDFKKPEEEFRSPTPGEDSCIEGAGRINSQREREARDLAATSAGLQKKATGDFAFIGGAEGKAMLERRLRDLVGNDVFEKFMADAAALQEATEVNWVDEKACIIKDVKGLRKDFDEVLQKLKSFRRNVEGCSFLDGTLDGDEENGFKDPDEVSINMELAVRHAEDCIMRLGMTLKNIGGEPSPYPNSYNPNNAIVEPTADNLKL